MKLYSVTATLAPTADFTRLRTYTDIVPGTVLLEDPQAPSLVFPVEASSVSEAVQFVHGVAVVGGLAVVSGEVSELDDGDLADDVPTEAQEWHDRFLVSS